MRKTHKTIDRFVLLTAVGFATVLALMVVPLGCGTAPAPQPEAGVTDVTMKNIMFDPQEITIKQGETVRWTNADIVPHTATSGNPGDADAGSIFDSPFLGSGQSFRHTFNETGEFIYYCRVHEMMMRDAKVIVEP